MISQKAKYAFKALLYLAERTPETTVQIDEIARGEGVPRKFLEQILLELKHSGLIASRRGRAGGYHLVRPAKEITIGQVLRIIDGPIAPLPCLSRTAYQRCRDCRDEANCSVRRLFSRTYAAMLDTMDAATLAEVLPGRKGGRGIPMLENAAAG